MKEAVTAAPADNTPFVIQLGNIDDLQKVGIPGHKKIMLKADNASKPAILKYPDNGHGQVRYTYFDVQSGASLTLEGQITLQGVNPGYRKVHYALYVNHNGNAEIKNGVTITGFKNTGRGTVVSDGELTMSGGTITGNTANRGGVYIHASWRHFTMTGGTIEKNKAYAGGGVLVKGTFDMKGGKITMNRSDRGKGVMVSGGTFNWQDGEITANEGHGNAADTEAGGTFNHNGHTAS